MPDSHEVQIVCNAGVEAVAAASPAAKRPRLTARGEPSRTAARVPELEPDAAPPGASAGADDEESDKSAEALGERWNAEVEDVAESQSRFVRGRLARHSRFWNGLAVPLYGFVLAWVLKGYALEWAVPESEVKPWFK